MEQSPALEASAGGLLFPSTPPPRPAAGRALLIAAFVAYAGLMGAAWWLALRHAPQQLSISLLGRTLDTDSVHEHVNNAFLIFLLLPSTLGVEAAVVGWNKGSLRQLLAERTPSIKTDLACFFLGQAHVLDVAGRLLTLGAAMISGAWVHDWLVRTTGFSLPVEALPFPLQIVAFFYVYSFFDYWTHRLDHTPRFWPLHRYHHSAEDFAVVTSVRQHPAAFTALFVVNLPMAVLGAPAEVMIYVNVLVVGIGFLIHSKLDSNWGWVGRWAIQSPNHHRLHHKLDMSYPTGHFAMAPIWDRLFGTWYGDADQSLAIGVDTPYRHGYLAPRDMLRDYLHFWVGLFGGRNDGPASDFSLIPRRKARS